MSTLGGGERAEEDMRAAGDEGAPKEPEEGGAIELSDEAVKVDSETEKEGKVVEESVLRDVLDDSRARRETISKNAEQVRTGVIGHDVENNRMRATGCTKLQQKGSFALDGRHTAVNTSVLHSRMLVACGYCGPSMSGSEAIFHPRFYI